MDLIHLGDAPNDGQGDSLRAAMRKINRKLGEEVSVGDYASLSEAREAAGTTKWLIDPAIGRSYLPHSDTYDLAEGVLSVGQFWAPENVVTVGDGKRNNLYRYDATIALGGLGAAGKAVFALHNYNLTVTSTAGWQNNDSYAFIGNITNLGNTTSKAIYGRATGGAGSTGVIVGGVFAVTPASGQHLSAGVQLSLDSTGATGGDGVGKAIDYGIWVGSNVSPIRSRVRYGILLDETIEVDTAGFQMFGRGDGDFLRLKSADGSADLFRVDRSGAVVLRGAVRSGQGDLIAAAAAGATLYLGTGMTYPLSINGSVVTIDNAAGRRLNFNGPGSQTVGTAGTAPAPPANPLGYLTVRVNGSDVKLPYYNP